MTHFLHQQSDAVSDTDLLDIIRRGRELIDRESAVYPPLEAEWTSAALPLRRTVDRHP